MYLGPAFLFEAFASLFYVPGFLDTPLGTLDRMDELLGKIENEEMREDLRNILVKGAKLVRYRKKGK